MLPRACRRILLVGLPALLGADVLARPRAMAPDPRQAAAPPGAATPGAMGVSGQGALRFRVLATAALLPEEARRVLVSAHGGFAVDHREGRGETYFFLPGAGILRLSADFKQIALVPTAPDMKDTNQHNTKIWYTSDGTAYLSFPANDKGRVFTTTLEGELVHTLARPTDEDTFGLPAVNFKHVHNAVLRQVAGRLYVIAQTWNPGDFAVLEQVAP